MWAHVIVTILGLWVMVSPSILGFGGTLAADNNFVVGPVVVTFAITGLFEATRNIRWWNMILGLWLVACPWLLSFDSGLAITSNTLTGVLIIAFSMVRGKVTKAYGGGWRSLFSKNPQHLKLARKKQ